MILRGAGPSRRGLPRPGRRHRWRAAGRSRATITGAAPAPHQGADCSLAPPVEHCAARRLGPVDEFLVSRRSTRWRPYVRTPRPSTGRWYTTLLDATDGFRLN